jgi:fibronectin-binding autotransporter adhesin
MDVVESYSNAMVLRVNFRRHRNRLCLGTALTLASLAIAGPAFAASPADGCTPTNTPANGQTVTCTGAVVLGVIAQNSTGVTVDVVPDATVIPPTGPAIWLGADAELNLGVRSVTGNEAIDSYAVLLGNGATVTLDGTIRGRGGITGPTQVSGSTGLAGAFITLNAGSQIVTNGSALNAAIDGRAGGNRYLVQGAIRATGTSGHGIRPGNGDIITLDTTGSITTLSGDTSNPIDGSGKTGVTVLTGVGSLIELHGIGRGIQLGANADLTLAGTIRSYGDAAGTNSAGGVGVEVGANSTVRLLAGGQIVTGNTGGLGNGGNGGTGITSFVSGTPSNTDVIVDGVIDTQRGQGIFGGIGDTLMVGATGRITTRSNARALFYNTQTSVGNGTLAIDIAGNVEQLGNTNALFISASRAQGETVETPVTANVTIRAGGRLHAAGNVAYAQDDGAGNFPEVIDNLVVAGTVSRGGVGVAIGLNDGADRVTFMPTYALIGDVDGGTDAAQAAETDTFALDGSQGTSATFNFGATQMRNFEAGEKLGAGSWTLTGDSSGLNGIFAVKQGMLTVNGVLTNTGVDVASGAVLGGSGAFTGAGTVASGGILLGSAGSDMGFGSLILNQTSQINVTLGAPSTAALFNVTGGLSLDGLLNVSNGGGFALGSYRLFDYAGTLTNNGLTIQTLPQGFNPGDWEIGTGTTGQVNLIVAAGPGEQYWDGGNLTPGNIANGRGGTASWNTTSTNWTNQAGSINAPWAGGIAVFAPCPNDGCTSGYTVTVDAAGVSAKGLRTLNAGVKLAGGTITLADDSRIDVTQPVLSGSGTLSASNAIHVTGDLIKGGIGSFLTTGQILVDGGLTVEQGVMSTSGATGVLNVAGAVTVGGPGTDSFPTRLVATAGAKLTSAGGSVGGAANTAGSIFIQFGGSWDAGNNAIDVGASGKGVLTVYSNFANEVSEVKASEIVLGRNAGGNGLLQIWGDDVDAILTTPTIRGGVGGGSVEFDNQSSTTASMFTPLLSGNLSTTFLSGVTTLKGINNYTGTTLVNGGKLFLDGASLPGTAVTVQRGTLGGAGTIAGAVGFAATNTILQGSAGTLLNMGSLALGSGTAVNVTLGAPSTSALFKVAGALTLDGLLNVTNGGGFGLGSYRLFDYAGALTNNGLTIQTLPQGFNPGDWAIGTGTTGQVNLIVAAGPGEQYWDGGNLTPGNLANGRGGTGTWNAANTNWTNQAGSINAAWAGQKAVFAKMANNTTGIVTIVGPQAFTGLRFLSGSSYDLVAGAGGTLVTTGSQAIVNVESAGVYTGIAITAPISGSGGINKIGAGSLILRGAHSYTGGTTVTEGTIYVGNGFGPGSIVGNVTTLGAAAANVDGGEIVFLSTSSAGSSSFTNNGVSVTGGRAGLTAFYEDATAANATFVNIGNSVAGGIGGGNFDQPFEYGGATAFYEDSNAGNAVITNRGSTIVGAYGGGVGFAESASAANATITNEGSTTNGAFGGATVFLKESSAGNATLIANGGTGGGGGGGIVFAEEAEGGTATIKLFGNGALDISAHIAPGVTVGSIEGNGLVLLGARTLSVGSNNASTSFSGTMANGGLYGGSGGSLTKLGTGTLTFAGTGAYTGATTVSGGTLLVNGALAATPTTTVASGAALGGSGTIAGATMIANGGALLGTAGADLGLASLALNPTSLVNVTLGAPSTAALFNVTGALTLDGLLNVTNGGGFGLGTYRLFDYGGALANNGLTIQTLPQGFNPGDWAIGTGTTGQVNLIVAAGPGEQYWDGTNLTAGNVANGRGGTATWNATSTNWTNQAGSINAPWASGIAVFGPCPANACVFGSGTSPSYTVTVDAAGVSAKGLRTLDVPVTFTGGKITLADDSRIDVNQPTSSGSGTLNASNIIQATGDLIKGGLGSFFFTGQTLVAGGLTVEQGVMMATEATAALNVTGAITVGGTGTDAFPTRLLATGGAKITSAGGSVGGAANTAGSIIIQRGGSWDAGANAIDVGASGVGVLRVYSSLITAISEIKASEIVLGRNAGGNGKLQIWGDAGNGIVTAATVRGGIGGGNVEFDNRNSTTYAFAPLMTGNLSATFLSGVTSLHGINDYSGATLVNGGKLFLDGASLTNSAVTVQRGTLGGTGTITGAVGFAATNAILQGSAGQVLNMGSLTLGSGTAINVTLGAPTTSALFNVTGALTLDGLLNVTDGGGFTYGAYRLFDHGGALTNNGLTIQALPAGFNPGDWTIDTATAGRVTLNVVQGNGDQYWDGTNLTPGGVANGRGGSGVWNATNTNWTNQANTINAPWASQTAVFAAAGASTITIAGTQTVTGQRFLSGANYSLIAGAGGGLTLSGVAQVALEQQGSDMTTAKIAAPIGGSGGLVKSGAGTLILTGTNTYAGGTTIDAGTLRVGDGGTTGSVTGDIANQGLLVFDRSDAFGFGGAITGAGSLVKTGAGTMTLTGAATQGGGTTVSAGTLRIGAGGSLGGNAIVSTGATLAFDRADAITHGGSIGGAGAILKQGAGTLTLTGNSSGFAGATSVQAGTLDLAGTLGGTLSVASGATLTGAGTASSAVTIGAGGTLSGRSGTTLAMGSLTFTEGAVINAALGASGGNRLFAVAGNLVLDGTLNVTDAGGYGLGVYRLFDYGGALTDNGLGIGQRPQADGTVTTVQTSQTGQVNLVVEVKTGPDFVQFWNGSTTSPTGRVVGGTGSWTAGPLTNWTNPSGSASYGWNGGFAVFQGTAGTVTAEVGVSTQGMQFAVDGYRLAGAPVTLASPGMTIVRVGDGSAAGATYRATVDAALTGASGLEKQDLGTLILTGANSYAGGTHIAAGTLSIGNGGTTGSVTGNIANDGALVFNRSNVYDFAGTISGAGTLTKLGADTLRLGGTHSYTGATLVSAGTLTVDGSIAGSAVAVAAGATLAGTGTVGTTSVAGTIAPGNSPGTLSIAGNYTQLAGSTYAYEPGDLIRVTGTAVIQGGRVSAANAVGLSYRLGDRSAILTAAGGRSGPGFAGVDLANPLTQPFLTLGLTYDATSVYLQAVRNAVTFESVGGTINQRAAARGVDGLAATNPLYGAMASIGSAAAARAGFDTLSGEIHATVKGVLLDESRHLREAVANRLDQAGAEGNGIWAHAIGAWGDADGDGNAAALDRSTAGLLFGVDTAFGGQWRAGLTGGYSRSKLDVDARVSAATVDSVQIGAFAGGRWGGTSLQLGAALAWHDIATRRASGFAGYADTTRGVYDARGLQLFARAGHVFDFGKATLEPFGTIAHARLKTDGFAEQGGTSALSAAKRTDSATWTTLGLRGSVPVGGQASLYGSAAWRHALDGHLPSADLAFGSGTPFRVYGTPLDRDAASLDLGIVFGIGGSGSFTVGYAGTIGSATSDHGIRASVAFRF